MNLTCRLSNNAELQKLFSDFLQEKRFIANLSKTTIKCYQQIFDRWIKYVGEIPTDQNLKTFIIKMREAGLSITTVNISIRTFNSFLSWMESQGHPRIRMKQLRNEKKIMRVFDDTHLKTLLAYRPKGKNETRIYTILCVIVDTGIRITEALTIKTSKVDLNNLVITVTGKGNKERVVPISIELRKLLFQYLKNRHIRFESPYFFCTLNGTLLTYRNAYRDLENIMGKAGISKENIDGFFHSFRRKFARSYVKNGGNVLYLMHAMGHTTLAMTKTYVEVETEDLIAAHLKISLLSRLR